MNDISKILQYFFAGLVFFILIDAPSKPTKIKKSNKPNKPKIEKKQDIWNYNISVVEPGYLSYEAVVNQLKTWHQEASYITEIDTMGQSNKGQNIPYIKITDPESKAMIKPKVLITACIHGNEKIATTVVMGIIGRILNQAKSDFNVKKLLATREIFFVPIISVDSYQSNQRAVLGRDPNRDFNSNPSVPEVEALKKFIKEHKFKAFNSGHAFGRIYVYPYGDTKESISNQTEYLSLLKEMKALSGYELVKGSNVYGSPMHGTEIDFGYRNGAYTIVTEYGTDFHHKDWEEELNKNYEATLLFIDKAPTIIK